MSDLYSNEEWLGDMWDGEQNYEQGLCQGCGADPLSEHMDCPVSRLLVREDELQSIKDEINLVLQSGTTPLSNLLLEWTAKLEGKL
tara:strand:- start:746 stop:1003 length:258 start_codon:yes stop_codon:yes gene_type:complete